MNAAVLSKGLLSRIVECIEDQLDQQTGVALVFLSQLAALL